LALACDPLILSHIAFPEKPSLRQAARRWLKKEEEQLQNERRQVREHRKLEDRAWQEARQNRKAQQETYQSLDKTQRRAQRKVKQAQQEQWQIVPAQRRAILEKRQQPDVEWRQKRNSLPERLSELPVSLVG